MTIQSDRAVNAFAEVLRHLRLARGDSQAVAASRIGVSLRTWQRMESNAAHVTGQVALGDFLAALETYGVDVAELVRPVVAGNGTRKQRGRTPTPLPGSVSLPQ